ncbi:O-antigen ligase family protein [uncultured Thiodictyon sp.]|jgi:O-antigen ligase|uniref:O-antigen ligase family protein n=1 Tax=uncultured Thiodictyon sp. TaxID=1846217 RepID=UPI0025F2D375|nr:O-antigen ligase family protein [uncultured Thiodictyon sp.]
MSRPGFTVAGTTPRVWIGWLALTLWLGCWAGINAGPWYLEEPPQDLVSWVNTLRTLGPLLPLVLWPLLSPLLRQPHRLPTLAEGLWIGYALLSLQAALLTGADFPVWYWALAYLGVFAAIDGAFGGVDPLSRAMATNRLVWLLATLLFVWMLFFARDVLLVQGKLGITAHGLVNRADLGRFGPISRSTGMARLAVVPAVVGLVMALERRGLRRLPWAALGLAAMLAIWLLQARQGIFGTAFALGLVAWLSGGRARFVGIAMTVLAGLALLGGLFPQDWLDYVTGFATRGDGMLKLQSMTGRNLIWRAGWRAVEQAPWLGFGPQADRRLIGLNAQNGLLYAALAAGYPGAALYLGGLLWGWVLFVRALLRGYARDGAERLFLLQVGGIMAYLTIRNIPENTAALYSVDLLLHAPLLAYLGTLDRVRGPAWRRARQASARPPWALA